MKPDHILKTLAEKMSSQLFLTWLITVLVTVLLVRLCASPQPPAAYHCCLPTQRKSFMDSIFSKIDIKGKVIASYIKTYGDHDNYEYIEVLPSDPAMLPTWIDNYRELCILDQKRLRIGMTDDVRDQIQVGDLFQKDSGAYIFNVIHAPGDTFKSELRYYGQCNSRNCTFERKGDTLCYWGWQ